MRISVFGLGYVGTVSAACLAHSGHTVIGVDTERDKVELINAGRSPVIEREITELISEAVQRNQLSATESACKAVEETDLSFVCVGTPGQPNGNLDLTFIKRVSETLGVAIRKKAGRHIVVVRSTILPGTMREVMIPLLQESSGKQPGSQIGICYNPEFLREGSAVQDFRCPPKTVIGELDQLSADTLASLYKQLDAPLIRTDIDTAEMIKYVDNSWHALKIGFANEIGTFCKAMSVDAHKVMQIFCQDKTLNISSAYLQPGFAFGGSCLPKDVRALTYKAKVHDLDLPIVNSILPSNEFQIARGVKLIMGNGHKRIGVLGFSFKAGTDDLRESPMIEVIERLIGKGYDLRLFDRNVHLARLVGANKHFILNRIPHISKLMVNQIDDILEHAETIVIGNGDPQFHVVSSLLRPEQRLIDFVRIAEKPTQGGTYEGICW